VRRRSWPQAADASKTVPLSPSEEAAYRRLRQHGVWANVARQLVSQKGAEQCLKYVEALSSQRGIADSGAWLKWAIETDFELPDTLRLWDGLSDGSSSSSLAGDNHNSPGADHKPVPDTGETELVTPAVANPRAEAVWGPLLAELSAQINTPSLLVWFEGTVPTAFEDSILVLQVPNLFALEYVETRFGELIRRMLKEQLGPDAELVVQAPDNAISADPAHNR
jgi:hypothetical protein